MQCCKRNGVPPTTSVPAGALPRLSQPVISRLQLRQQRRAGLGVLRTVGCELQPAAAALEQRGPEFGFEGADQLCDGLQDTPCWRCRGRQAAALCGREGSTEWL